MNIDTFKMVIAIVQTGSISGAAQQLGYAQSNISAKVHQLESELKTTIFYRTNRGVVLTPDGKKFYKRAIEIVNLTEDTIHQLQSPTMVAGDLHIGTLQSASESYLPPILVKYHHKFPRVKLAIATGNPLENIHQVLNYELDGAVVGENVDESELESIPLTTEELCLVSASPEIPDLDHTPFLVFSPSCIYREVAEDWLKSLNKTMHHPIEFNYLDGIMASVCAGLGIGIVPKHKAELFAKEKLVYMTELPKEFSSIQLSFIYRKDYVINRPFSEFVNVLQK